MAVFSPFGLLSCDTRLSAVWNNKANQSYQINPSDTTPIYVGDPVTVVGGYVTKYLMENQTGGANVSPPLGVFLGCNFTQTGNGYSVPFFRSWNGSTSDVVPGTPVYAIVEDDINSIFKVQISAPAGVLISATYKNAQLVLPTQLAIGANPNQTSIVSIATPGTGATTDDMKVVGIFDAANGGAYNASPTLNQWSVTGGTTCPNPILLVQWNNHITRAGTIGAA